MEPKPDSCVLLYFSLYNVFYNKLVNYYRKNHIKNDAKC